MTTNEVKAKRNKKQVCFSDEELTKYGEFLKSKGKFSLYVKRLIEEDFNGSNNQVATVDLSVLEDEIKDLKALMLDEFKKINNTPQMTKKQPTEEQQNKTEKVINDADKKREQAALNSFMAFAK